MTHSSLGFTYLFKGNHDQAFFHLNKALELNPGDINALTFLSRCEMLSGNPERAIERINEASRYNPFGKYNWSLVPAYYAMQRYDEAKLAMNAIQSPAAMMIIWMAAVYAQAGNIMEASELVAKFVAIVEQILLIRVVP